MSETPASFGICRMPAVPVRKADDHRAEQVTQLLFGDLYEVLEVQPRRAWVPIRVHADGCTGWISRLQHHPVETDYVQHYLDADYRITTEVTSVVLYQKTPLTIVLGSIVPITGHELFKMEDAFAFNGEAKNLSQRRDADFLLGVARRYLGAPEVWGGKTPFGIDAAALVQMSFRVAGYALPRFAAQQFLAGQPVAGWQLARPGDLAFFRTSESETGHVGIIIDNDRVLHVHGHAHIAPCRADGIPGANTPDLVCCLTGIRRILNTPA